ncbi:hypothetical protein [uncultured Anaerovibrio sp.]|nr:hypothetical protein [uncultured Anaerovibrio sp.]
MAKYTNSPISYFLKMPIGEFYSWVEDINSEIKAEEKAIKDARKGK